MKKKIKTEVDATTNSTNPELKVEFDMSIAPLDLEFGRADLNLLRDKINEIIRKK